MFDFLTAVTVKGAIFGDVILVGNFIHFLLLGNTMPRTRHCKYIIILTEHCGSLISCSEDHAFKSWFGDLKLFIRASF